MLWTSSSIATNASTLAVLTASELVAPKIVDENGVAGLTNLAVAALLEPTNDDSEQALQYSYNLMLRWNGTSFIF